MKNKKYGLAAALSIVIANMIGTGVFTSLGFQLFGINNTYTIVFLWATGGVIAMMGSICYAELSAAFPSSGGEYHFLRISFGKYTGFLSGWTSALVGFAAPMAAAAFAFSKYFQQVLNLSFDPLWLSAGILILVTIIQLMKMQIGERFQVVLTIGKVLVMITFIILGFLLPGKNVVGISKQPDWSELWAPAFWTSLIYVSYSYSGWNASAYIIDDIDRPKRNVPLSILSGTLFVMLLYVLINYIFMRSAPLEAMRGKEEVAHVAADYLIGAQGARIVSGMITFFLISSISSMAIVGPRVIKRMADDYEQFSYLAKKNKNGIPLRAMLLQLLIALTLLFSSSFDFIINSIGFLLTIFTTLTVVGLIILRWKQPNVERSIQVPLYPIIPLLFIGFNIFTIIYLIKEKPTVAIISFLFLLAGSSLYFFFTIRKRNLIA